VTYSSSENNNFIFKQQKKKKRARCQGLMPVNLAIQETEIRRIRFQVSTGNSLQDSILETTNSNRAGRVAQVVEPIPNKPDALSSNHSNTQKEGIILK
jgi:hypothetical protein